MKPVESKKTSQAQGSAPARTRRNPCRSAGSRIDAFELVEDVIVQQLSIHSSLDIHEAVFDTVPDRRSIDDMDDGIRSRTRRNHGRRQHKHMDPTEPQS